AAFADRRQRHRIADLAAGRDLPGGAGRFADDHLAAAGGDRDATVGEPGDALRHFGLARPLQRFGGGAFDLPAGAFVDDRAARVFDRAFAAGLRHRQLPGRVGGVAGERDRGEVRFRRNSGGQAFGGPGATVAEQQALLADRVAATWLARVEGDAGEVAADHVGRRRRVRR